MIRSGGYPTRERTVPALLRGGILQRDSYCCKLCGKEGNEIDHIAGSANTLKNIRCEYIAYGLRVFIERVWRD